MKLLRRQIRMPRESVSQGFALAFLLILGAIAVAGPSGILAWSENGHLLAQRQAEVARLQAERDELRNRVGLLDPRRVDPDLTGELLRRDMNVLHRDEMVMILD